MNATAPARQLTVDVERPVLVLGVGRSGTSLLQSMLNAHPELAFPPETHFFRRYVAPGAFEAWGEGERAALRRLLEADDDFARAGITPRELLAHPRAEAGPSGAFEALLELTAQRAQKSRVGDKDPKNIDSLPALAEAFPGAFVIHLVRDPRDVLLSRTKAAWSAKRPWWTHPWIYREQLRHGGRMGRLLFGERYLELRYEDLLAEPEAKLRRLLRHVELDWDPAVLSFGESAARLVDERELAWKRETLGPLLAGNCGKWREGLRPAQVAYCEEVCREAFQLHGYEPSRPRRTHLRLLAAGMAPAAALAYERELRRGARA